MNAINAVLGSFLTIYFTNAAFLDAGIIATIIAVSKVFDGISDLIVGNMVDRTHSRYGKARVWLMRMCIPFAVSTILLFFVPQSLPDAVKYVYVFIMYNLVNARKYPADRPDPGHPCQPVSIDRNAHGVHGQHGDDLHTARIYDHHDHHFRGDGAVVLHLRILHQGACDRQCFGWFAGKG